MTQTAERLDVITPVAITDDLTAMADYVRSADGRQAIERGMADIRDGRTIAGEDALASELNKRASIRRQV